MLSRKLKAIMVFDFIIAFTPLLSKYNVGLVDVVNSILVVLTTLTLVITLFMVKDSKEYKKIYLDQQSRPKWWGIYDILSDLVYIIVWAYFGYMVLVYVYILSKIVIVYKFPNTYRF